MPYRDDSTLLSLVLRNRYPHLTGEGQPRNELLGQVANQANAGREAIANEYRPQAAEIGAAYAREGQDVPDTSPIDGWDMMPDLQTAAELGARQAMLAKQEHLAKVSQAEAAKKVEYASLMSRKEAEISGRAEEGNLNRQNALDVQKLRNQAPRSNYYFGQVSGADKLELDKQRLELDRAQTRAKILSQIEQIQPGMTEKIMGAGVPPTEEALWGIYLSLQKPNQANTPIPIKPGVPSPYERDILGR